MINENMPNESTTYVVTQTLHGDTYTVASIDTDEPLDAYVEFLLHATHSFHHESQEYVWVEGLGKFDLRHTEDGPSVLAGVRSWCWDGGSVYDRYVARRIEVSAAEDEQYRQACAAYEASPDDLGLLARHTETMWDLSQQILQGIAGRDEVEPHEYEELYHTITSTLTSDVSP